MGRGLARWKIAFLIGALPAVYVFLIRLHMPESVRYLISKNKIDEAKEIILSLEKKLNVESKPFAEKLSPAELGSEKTAQPKFSSLWSSQFRIRTIMLWVAWFGIVYSYYGIFMWLPSIVFAQGFAVVKTFEYVLIMTLAQLPGYYAAAWDERRLQLLFRKCAIRDRNFNVGQCDELFQSRSVGSNLHLHAGTLSDFNPRTRLGLGGRFRQNRRNARAHVRRHTFGKRRTDEFNLCNVRVGIRFNFHCRLEFGNREQTKIS